MKQIVAPQFDSPTIDDSDDLGTIGNTAAKNGYHAIGVTPNRKKAKAQKADPRGFRWQVRVWLDANKPDQLSLGKWIHEQKRMRKFAPILRNALALYRELMEGKTDLLYELFPHLKPTPPPADDELRKRLALLEQVVISQRSPGNQDNGIKMLTNNSVPKNGHKATAPAPADDNSDTLVVTKDKDAGSRSAQNFINSAFALQGITLNP